MDTSDILTKLLSSTFLYVRLHPVGLDVLDKPYLLTFVKLRGILILQEVAIRDVLVHLVADTLQAKHTSLAKVLGSGEECRMLFKGNGEHIYIYP